MAKLIDCTLAVPINAGAVRNQLQNATDLTRIAHASGPIEASATIEADGSTRVVRVYEAPANVRGFMKVDTIEIIERRTWTQSGATLSAEVTGFPVTITGTIELKEHGDNCIMHIMATVQASMGVASPLAEGMVKDRFVAAVQAECEALF